MTLDHETQCLLAHEAGIPEAQPQHNRPYGQKGSTVEKTLNVTSMDEVKAKVKDVEVFGNHGAWVLLGKASSESEGWMKSTKAMQTPEGVLVQASTQQKNPDGSCAVAEALTFIPGARLRQVSGNHWEFARSS